MYGYCDALGQNHIAWIVWPKGYDASGSPWGLCAKHAPTAPVKGSGQPHLTICEPPGRST